MHEGDNPCIHRSLTLLPCASAADMRRKFALYGGLETAVRLMVLERTPRAVIVEVARLCANIAEDGACVDRGRGWGH